MRPSPDAQEKREPAGTNAGELSDLEAESSLRWSFKRRADGSVAKMAEGRLFLGVAEPHLAARIFLERFARGAFGFDPGTAGVMELHPEGSTFQVVVPQLIHGLLVHGARTNLIFDSEGHLVYAVSDMYRGGPPPAPSPAVSAQASSAMARAGLAQFLVNDGKQIGGAYPASFFRQHERLAYRLVGSSVGLVYIYEFPLSAPQMGDMEIMVDAEAGGVVLIRNRTRR